MVQLIFKGYSRTRKSVWVIWEDGNIFILYLQSGRKIRWNDEYYDAATPLHSIRQSLLNSGYEIVD